MTPVRGWAGKRWFRTLTVPDCVSPRTYFASLIGPLLVSAALAVQLVLTAVLFVEPPGSPADLTRWGEVLFIPERDVVIFLAGIIVSALLSAGFVWTWNRRLRSAGSPSDRFLIGSLVTQAVAAVGGTVLFLTQFFAARADLVEGNAIRPSFPVAVAAIALLLVASALIGWRKPGAGEPKESRLQERLEGSRVGPIRPQPSLLDLLIPLVVVAVVYIPAWRLMSGRVFMEESLFHWDWFAMGPTLTFHHGGILGTDVYTMYGVAWPLLFNAIDPWIPISYGRMIQIGSLYTCIYFVGLYVLLRLLVHRPGLAALGTGLAIAHLFLAMGELVMWRFPSNTPMRWALDVWCLIALVLHWRSQRRIWAVAAGLAIGLALLVSTDTGLYLAAGVTFYWLGTLMISSQKPRLLLDAAVSVVAAWVVLLSGLLVASRGTLFSGAFWKGWLEPLLEFGAGFAQLPLATVPNTLTVVTFVFVALCYLVVLGYCINKLLHARASHFVVFNGSVALYGLLTLNHFVGRSGDFTVFRLYIPLVIIAVHLAGRAYGHAGNYVRGRWGPEGRTKILVRTPYVVAGLALVLLMVLPRSMLVDPLLEYPNLISNRLRGESPDGLCLLLEPKDLCGLDPRLEEPVATVRALSEKLEDLDRAGKRVAVIDESGSLFYLASDTAPWGRYPRVFVVLTTLQKLEEVTGSLEDDPPDYILTRRPVQPNTDVYERWWFTSFGLGPHPDSTYSDTWEGLLSVVRENYRLLSVQEPFGLWRYDQPPER